MLKNQNGIIYLESGRKLTLAKLQEVYLDWINNFLTVERFAEYYDLTVEEANVIIQAGRKIQELYAQMLKDLQSLVLS